MKLPLTKALKKRTHAEIALLQDEVVDVIYAIADKPVLHGGTAIWRCYGGNRFSEDLDFYFLAGEQFRERFHEAVAARGLGVTKFKKTQNTIFAKVTNGTVEVRLEVGMRRPKGYVVRQYERADGTFSDVYTLTPEALALEKMNAYRSRRLIRDIYDVYHLRNMLGDTKVSKEIMEALADIQEPLDEKTLRTAVYSGAIPTFRQMIEMLRGGS